MKEAPYEGWRRRWANVALTRWIVTPHRKKNWWTLDAPRGGYAPQADLLHMLRFAELSGIAS